MEFKIIACPDKSQQSTYRHAGMQLTIGSSNADMVIDDPNLSATQVRIFFQGGFLLENLDPQVEVRLNGKLVEDRIPVKERDNITMGRSTVNFILLNQKPFSPPEPYQHPQAAARFVPGNKEKAVLDALEFLAAQEMGIAAKPSSPPAVKPPLPGGAGGAMPPLPRKG